VSGSHRLSLGRKTQVPLVRVGSLPTAARKSASLLPSPLGWALPEMQTHSLPAPRQTSWFQQPQTLVLATARGLLQADAGGGLWQGNSTF